jgi:hypothetical protein
MSLRKVSLASCSRYLNLIFLKNSWGGSKDTRHTSYAGKDRRVSIEDGKRGTEGRAGGRRLFGTNDLSRDLLPYESRVTRIGGHRAIGEGLGEVRLGLGEELFLHRGDMELGRVKGRDDAAGEREREARSGDLPGQQQRIVGSYSWLEEEDDMVEKAEEKGGRRRV